MGRVLRALILSCCVAVPATSAELSADEQEVWSLEVNYWEYVKQNDVTSYRALWDERFVGWPRFSRSPMDKKRIHEWFAPYHEDPARKFDYELQMESVRSYGSDLVVAHYLAQGRFISTETGEELPGAFASRIMHTWQRSGDSWLIITGMSGTWIGSDPD